MQILSVVLGVVFLILLARDVRDAWRRAQPPALQARSQDVRALAQPGGITNAGEVCDVILAPQAALRMAQTAADYVRTLGVLEAAAYMEGLQRNSSALHRLVRGELMMLQQDSVAGAAPDEVILAGVTPVPTCTEMFAPVTLDLGGTTLTIARDPASTMVSFM